MKLHRVADGIVAFHCPGCDCGHHVRISGGGHPLWQWNGSMDRPTFVPSVLVRSGHYVPGYHAESCWCTYNAEHPDDPGSFECGVCHSFVIDGLIQFLQDSTHNLSGKTVEIPDWDRETEAH